jgi:rubredoxin
MKPETRLYAPSPCPECGGQRVVVACDPRMGLEVTMLSYVHLVAHVCNVCGYTTFYAEKPEKFQKLLEDVQR